MGMGHRPSCCAAAAPLRRSLQLRALTQLPDFAAEGSAAAVWEGPGCLVAMGFCPASPGVCRASPCMLSAKAVTPPVAAHRHERAPPAQGLSCWCLRFLGPWRPKKAKETLCLRAVRANKSFRIVCVQLYCISVAICCWTTQVQQAGHRRECTVIAENTCLHVALLVLCRARMPGPTQTPHPFV